MKNTQVLLPIFLIFLGAIFLRILLINWTLNYGYNGDFVRYEDWARISHIYTFADSYTTHHLSVWKTFPNNQPPGSLYILSASYESWILIGKILAHLTHIRAGSNIWVNTHLQHILMKTPAFLSDLLIGCIVYLLVAKDAGKKRAAIAASLILFTPITFYNSAIWGQMDSLNNFFFLLSLFLAFRKNTILSIFSYTASLYIKLSLLPLLPFYLIFMYFLSKKNLKRIIVGIILSLSFTVIATFPISSQPLPWLMKELPIIARGEFQNITEAAFNFWWTITCFPTICKLIPLVTDTFLGIPLNIWAYMFFGIFTLPCIYLQVKRPKQFITEQNLFLMLSLVALFAFLFLPNMHDRYMYPVFPLLAVAVGLSKKLKTYLVIFGFLSLFHLINLIYSWYPAPFPFFVFYQILYSYLFRWSISLLTLIIAGWFYWKSMREFVKVKHR